MKRWRVSLAAVFCLLFLVSCAGTFAGIKPWAEKTPQEKAVVMMAFYNTQYKDTYQMATTGTPDQKKMAAEKKKILVTLWPLIGSYDTYASTGVLLIPGLEEKILKLINDLGGKI